MHILSHLDKHLHLAPGTLAALHRLHRSSTDQVRLLKLSPQPESDRRTSLPHTDFGSVTLLWNYLGGFQILRPESQVDEECWEFVEPEPGCAVVNMGDAMVKFSNGVVRSNLHRVANAPGEQAVMGNHSLGYFSRPSNKVLMKALSGGENKSSSDKHAKGQENRIYTMKEWVAKREELYRKGVEPRQSTGGMAGMAIAWNGNMDRRDVLGNEHAWSKNRSIVVVLYVNGQRKGVIRIPYCWQRSSCILLISLDNPKVTFRQWNVAQWLLIK